MTSFGERLHAAMAAHGPLCAGIDPHPRLLRDWGLDDDVRGLERFSLSAVEAFAGDVAAVKPQAAFFERHGSAGVAVLERVVAELRSAGTLCVVDAKRGDVGSTMQAYADAFAAEGSPLAGDAVTASPYLGFESLRPLLDAAAASGRGVFVLALTSNPEGGSVQHAVGVDGMPVAAAVARAAAAENAGVSGGLGSVGLVVGATVGPDVARLGIDLAAVRGPLLAPGLGAQGAAPEDLRAVFGDASGNVLPAASRGLLAVGPGVAAMRVAARDLAEQLVAVLAL